MRQDNTQVHEELTPSQAAEFLRTCIRRGRPALLRGEAGIGKSDIVFQTAAGLLKSALLPDWRDDWRRVYASDLSSSAIDAMIVEAGDVGIPVIDVRLSQLSDVDLRGVPSIQRGRTIWNSPAFLPVVGPVIMFWDELNRGLTSTQNAALQAIRDNRIGEYVFPRGTVHVAAINPEGSAAGTGITRMSQPLNNRFVHCNVCADLNDWCKWANQNGIRPEVIAYLRFKANRQELALHEPSRTDYAFPTPRSWAFVSEILEDSPAPAVEVALYSGAVGHVRGGEFAAFLRMFRSLASVDGILLNPASAPVPSDVSALYAITAALASRITDSNIGRALTYLQRVTAAIGSAEYEVYAIQDATGRDSSLCSTGEFIRWAVDHQDLMG